MRALAIPLFVLLGCGVDHTAAQTQQSQAPLCGTEPHLNANGTVTAIDCPFEQQYDNIAHHGTHFSAAEQLHASNTQPGVAVTDSCGSWFLGTDSNGVTVFVSSDTGEVRSHGQVHAGFETSTLPATLTLPISAQ